MVNEDNKKQLQVLEEIHKYIINEKLPFDIKQISLNTDLIEMGIESIIVLSILADVEKKLNMSLSLEKLELSGYKVTAITIATSLS